MAQRTVPGLSASVEVGVQLLVVFCRQIDRQTESVHSVANDTSMKSTKNSGFTLVELMMVIAIIGILSMLGVPQYMVYSKRAKFVDVVNAANQVRDAVEICLLTEGNSISCDSSDKIGIDQTILEANDNIDSVLISEVSMGTIGVALTASTELNQATYVLRGTYIPTTTQVAWLLDPASSCLEASNRYCSD